MAGSAGKTRIAVDTGTLADGDSIAAYLVAGGTQLTQTGGALDVNVTASALPTGAATETTLASVLTELQALTFAEDSAHASGDLGIMGLAVRADSAGSLVSADGDYSPLQVDANGALRVNASVTIGDNQAEDSTHSSGATGSFVLSVRNDNQATTFTSATGDYSPFATDLKGAVYTKSVHAASNLQQIVTVGTTAVALPASPLANRTSMFVQMLSAGSLYLGSATVTNSGATRGLLLGNGGYVSVDVAPGNLVYGIANAAGKDVAVWEFA
jgi:hypothetical protein